MKNIYSQTEMGKNWLYRPVMEEINTLYQGHGCPPAPIDGPTTDREIKPHWHTDGLHAWQGKENLAADFANTLERSLLESINRGAVSYYYESPEFTAFVDDAWILIQDFNAEYAFNRLVNNWEW